MGDVRGIRERIDYDKKANQTLHQQCYSKFTAMIEYKAQQTSEPSIRQKIL